MNKLGWIGTGGAAAALAVALGCAAVDTPGSNVASVASATATPAPGTTDEINPVVTNCNTTLPPVAPAVVTPTIAQSGLPCAVAFDGTGKVNLDTLQQAFDFNSWLTFVALNAPATSAPDSGTIWEDWQDLSSLMLPGGATPPPFGTSVPPPAICTGAAPGAPVLRMISKTPITPTVSVAGQPLNTGPLIDQNGNYARYQILVNEPMYDYIVANNLYSKAGQQRFTGSVQFPVGQDLKPQGTGTIGAIVLKVAWKVLAGGDDPATFLTVNGYVYSPAMGETPATCRRQTLGLVGLHIVHKTANEPQWNWATFEHAGNAPSTTATNGRFNFYDPACGKAACPVNKQPPQPWNPSIQPFPKDFHSQVVRTTQYPREAVRSAALWNPQFQAALKGNVLANYELITTQWPTLPTSKTDPNGAPFPLFAANTTMETYVQGNVPQASSSCMACHGNATDTAGKPSDFSFVLEKAQ
jgi:hypothetical protein